MRVIDTRPLCSLGRRLSNGGRVIPRKACPAACLLTGVWLRTGASVRGGRMRNAFLDQLGNFLFIVFWSVILLVAVYWVVRRAIRDESSQRTKND